MLCQTCDTKNVEDARFCANCGTTLATSPQPAVVPQTRPFELPLRKPKRRRVMRTCLLVSSVLFVLLVLCGGMAALLSDDHPPASAMEKESATVAITDETAVANSECEDGSVADKPVATEEVAQPINEQQEMFIHTVESFYSGYHEAENELQSSMQRAKRKAALTALLPDRAVQEWTGTLESLDTDSNGNAFITIRPDGTETVTFATWQNALMDAGTNSMIQSGSDLYNKLAKMSVGDYVVFSGTFVSGDADHLAERSLTEAASMTTPSFVMVFADVRQQE